MTPETHSTTKYRVEGMTCEHCRRSVAQEVAIVGGVEAVEVELADGSLTVAGGGFSDASIQAAVERAGYRMAER